MVEDSEDDAELLLREITKGGLIPSFERVWTRDAFTNALRNRDWDIILCDYSMPGFNGMEALQINKQRGNQIPFILISGTIGEELAVEAMVRGARDYIMKDRLHRLVPAITRELEETRIYREKEKNRIELLHSEERFSKAFRTSTDGIVITRLKDGVILQVNDEFCRLFGYEKNQIIGRSSINIHFWSSEKEREEVVKKLKGQGLVKNHATLFQTASGTLLNVLLSCEHIDLNGEECMLCFIRDITDLKLAEQKYRQGLDGAIMTISKIIEIRDPYTAGHQTRASRLASAIAEQMELPEDDIETVRVCSLLYEIGKIKIPSEILNKPGKLNDLEYELVRGHVQTGSEILSNIDFPWPVARVVLQHHERMDGSGYPNGLKGDQIMIEARILAVADVVEAMASHRPYRASLGVDAALEELENNRGTLYDPTVVDATLTLFRKKGFTLEE